MRGNPLRFTNFTGGVNTNDAPYLVAENECRDCRNVISSARGSVKKRPGCTTFCSTFTGAPTAINSLFGMQTTTALVAVGSTKMYSINSVGTSTDITGAATITTGLPWSILEAPISAGPEGPLYAMNGTDTPLQWSGAGNVAPWITAGATAIPNGKYMVLLKNRIFVAGVASNPSRLYSSDSGNPRGWETAGTGGAWTNDFDPGDGGIITGLGTIGPYLLVFKERKTFLVYDTETSNGSRRLSGNYGCISNKSIVESPGGTFFLTLDSGIALYDGTSIKLISQRIDATLYNIPAVRLADAAGVFLNDHYYLSIAIAGGTTNALTVDYDTRINSWWLHSNSGQAWTVWRSTNAAEIYFARSGAGAVDKAYVTGITQDNSANFTAYWTGPWQTAESYYRHRGWAQPYVKKRLRQIHVDGTGIIDAYIGTDFSASTTQWALDIFGYSSVSTLFGGANNLGGIGAFGDSGSQAQRRLYSFGVGRAFSFEIRQTNSQVMEMDAYTMYMNPRTN